MRQQCFVFSSLFNLLRTPYAASSSHAPKKLREALLYSARLECWYARDIQILIEHRPIYRWPYQNCFSILYPFLWGSMSNKGNHSEEPATLSQRWMVNIHRLYKTHTLLKSCNTHSSRNSRQNHIPIRFPSPSGHITQASLDQDSPQHGLVTIILPKASKRTAEPASLEAEISGHKFEKVSLTKWIQWQRKRCPRVANPSSGNRNPRAQLYFVTTSVKKKAHGVYCIKELRPWLQPVSKIFWEIRSHTWSESFLVLGRETRPKPDLV